MYFITNLNCFLYFYCDKFIRNDVNFPQGLRLPGSFNTLRGRNKPDTPGKQDFFLMFLML